MGLVQFSVLWDNSLLTPLPPMDPAVSSLDGSSFALGPTSFHPCLKRGHLRVGGAQRTAGPNSLNSIQHPAGDHPVSA